MPQQSYIFDPTVYVTDRGTNVTGLSGRFRNPGNVGDVGVLLTAVGARIKTAADRTPCPVSAGFNPRKLIFVRRSGNSFSLIAPNRANLVANANDVVTAVGAADPVVCIRYEGERWDDLMAEISTRNAAATAGTDPETVGKKGWYSVTANYTLDPTGAAAALITVQQKFKVQTEVPPTATTNGDAPALLGGQAGIWGTAVGAPLPDSPCPGYGNAIHRRYKGTFLITRAAAVGGQSYASLEVPVASSAAAQILAAGQAIANSASIVCLGYEGETIPNFHRIAGVTLPAAAVA